jgi:type IV pilus assembly protein PilE
MAALRLRRPRGFTLIDLSVTLAVAGILASVALPSYQSQLARARRNEAILGLIQVQAAQEQFRASHGSYSLRLEGLRGVMTRGEHYEIILVASHASGYMARAQVTDGQRRDEGCGELTLSVLDGVATQGPSERCWNRS